MIAVTEQQTEEAERFVPIEGAEWPVWDAAWRRSTQLEILAWELARYEPELATRLAEAGVHRLRVG
jgi:hypothetical protein